MTNKTAALLPPIRVRNFDDQIRSLIATTYRWIGTQWLQIIIAVAVASAIVVALHFIRRLARKYCARPSGPNRWIAVIARAVVATGNIFMVILAVKVVSAANFAGTPSEVRSTINFLWILAAGYQGAIWAREIIIGAIEYRTAGEHYSGEAIGSAMGIIRILVGFAVFAIAAIVVLDNLGVNVTGLIAGLGVGGIAIGLAAQGIFADLFAALAIIFDRPFRRGDAISYDKSSGTVEAIGLKSTRIRGVTGEERIVANKQLLEKEIINNTQRAYRRVVFTLGIVQWTPIETLEALPTMIKDVIEEKGMKFVRAGFTTFGASSYDFDIEFDSPSAAFQEFYDARHLVGLAIIRCLNEAGISLAYPTQTSFTAAPDGEMVLPYAQTDPHPTPGKAAPPSVPETRQGTGASPSSSAADGDSGHG
ncbi:mechanosensitive ion channel family protein [Sphingomonas sp. RB3P16]|uniref:mechanosensitive ion channel family protein n=1 Tax=Parasphingomonas frigoris TaxID=3096163 RepID=UPI002FC61807